MFMLGMGTICTCLYRSLLSIAATTGAITARSGQNQPAALWLREAERLGKAGFAAAFRWREAGQSTKREKQSQNDCVFDPCDPFSHLLTHATRFRPDSCLTYWE